MKKSGMMATNCIQAHVLCVTNDIQLYFAVVVGTGTRRDNKQNRVNISMSIEDFSCLRSAKEMIFLPAQGAELSADWLNGLFRVDFRWKGFSHKKEK